mmetsp:Transcript_139372/g.338605  ORF Transcript_139372/g.338605 Transcript_139372/m.338605 type:complete len:107 (+) Transcript_139372:559-879(+)
MPADAICGPVRKPNARPTSDATAPTMTAEPGAVVVGAAGGLHGGRTVHWCTGEGKNAADASIVMAAMATATAASIDVEIFWPAMVQQKWAEARTPSFRESTADLAA